MKYYDMLEQQVDLISQAVELLLLRAEEQLSLSEGELLRALRDELLAIRTERGNYAKSDVPESLHPPFEYVRFPKRANDGLPPTGADSVATS